MYATQLIVSVFDRYHGQRGPSAVYHLFKGKKSGQTIQDVGLFQLYPFFSITPKLTKTQYDTYLESLFSEQFLLLTEDNVLVTPKGKAFIQDLRAVQLDGWHYRGREMIFFQRLSLVIQTLSQQQHSMRFIPVEKEGTVQRYVKAYLMSHPYADSTFRTSFYEELIHLLNELPVSDVNKQIFAYRLTGYKKSGLTWTQISTLLNEDIWSLQLRFQECLHSMLNTAQPHSLIGQLMQHLRIEQVLTQSTQKTAELYEQGYSLQQIATIRHLKESTIEDHFAEMAMNDARFPIEHFVTKELMERILETARTLETTKLRLIKERVQDANFFQIRLVLAARRLSK